VVLLRRLRVVQSNMNNKSAQSYSCMDPYIVDGRVYSRVDRFSHRHRDSNSISDVTLRKPNSAFISHFTNQS